MAYINPMKDIGLQIYRLSHKVENQTAALERIAEALEALSAVVESKD